jgi:hypothetical protein
VKLDHAELQTALGTVRSAFDVALSKGAHPEVLGDLVLALSVLDGLGAGIVPQVYTRATYRMCAEAMRHAPELTEVAKLFAALEAKGSL